MLIALLTALAVIWLGSGGGGDDYLPKELNKRVKSEVSDKQVRKDVEALVKQINKDIGEYREDAERLARDMMELSADYDAELESFESLVDQVVSAREDVQKKAIDSRLKLVDLLTVEEWKAVFAEEG